MERGLGAALPLEGVEDAVRIDLSLEPGQERGSRRIRQFTRVVLRVKSEGADPRPLPPKGYRVVIHTAPRTRRCRRDAVQGTLRVRTRVATPAGAPSVAVASLRSSLQAALSLSHGRDARSAT